MKRVIAGLALALAVGAFAAHPQTLNKEGMVGVNKTQSGQSQNRAAIMFAILWHSLPFWTMPTVSTT